MLAAATDSLSGISFERDADAPHLVVLAFAVDTINPNILLYNVAATTSPHSPCATSTSNRCSS